MLGWFGHQNLGDELILEGIKKLFSGWHVNVYSDTDRSSYPTLDLKAVNDSDLFVVGGGELIHRDRLFYYSPFVRHTNIPAFLHRWFSFGWAWRVKTTKIILGCGLESKDGFINGAVYSDLYNCQYIGIRDTWSFDRLKEAKVKGVEFFPDLTYALNLKSAVKTKEDLAVVIPTNRSHLDTVNQSRKWLTKLLAKYREVAFIPFGRQDNDDYITCLQLSASFKNSYVLEHKDVTLEKVIELFSSCGLVVPYRLHGLILAHVLGKQFKFWPYHTKLTRMFHTVHGKTPEELMETQKLNFDRLMDKLEIDTF